MTFGGQSVTVVTVSESGEPGYLGVKTKTRSEVVVSGCHFRPLSTSETVGQTDVATQLWKLTAPPVDAVLGLSAGDELVHADTTFQVDGVPLPKYDLAGQVHHVTVTCKRHG